MSHLPASVCVSQNTKRRSLDPPCHLYATCAVLSKIYNVWCVPLLLCVLYQTSVDDDVDGDDGGDVDDADNDNHG